MCLATLCMLPCVARAEYPCSSFSEGNTVLLDERVFECSGLALSHSNDDYFWAINDSGCDPELFLLDRNGAIVRTYRVKMTRNVDWEDIAIGPCEPWGTEACIFVADIGNNVANRPGKRVLAIREPDLGNVNSSADDIVLDLLHTWNVQYPPSEEKPELSNPDAESMMVRPGSGEIYIVSKHNAGGTIAYDKDTGEVVYDPDIDGVQRLYRMERGGENAGKLEMLAEWKFNSSNPLSNVPMFNATTSADFAPDGYHFAVRTYAAFFEYDLIAYPDIAEAFLHPVERGHSQVLHQWEAITYDRDGKSLVTATEKGDGQTQKMAFWSCVDNAEYVPPTPIAAPDPLPTFEAAPDPEYQECNLARMHVWNETCEFDNTLHCGSHANSCEALAHWSVGDCDISKETDKHCVVTECADGFVPTAAADGCECRVDEGYHVWDKPCEGEGCTEPPTKTCTADSVDDCGSHGVACKDTVDHWGKGLCFEKSCVVMECSDDFEPTRAGDACKCDPQSKHVWNNRCVASSLEHCGSHDNACAKTVGWKEGECKANQCVATKCADGFTLDETTHTCKCGANQHVWENRCEDESLENCGEHGVRCADVENWVDGTCTDRQCVPSECADGFVPLENACVPENRVEMKHGDKGGGCSSVGLRGTTGAYGVWALLLLGVAAIRRRVRIRKG